MTLGKMSVFSEGNLGVCRYEVTQHYNSPFKNIAKEENQATVLKP